MEGLNPSGPPDADELLNSAMWYNWHMNNKRNRIAHINLQKVRTLLEFPGVDSATVREMSAETKDEVYCLSALMLYHCGLIYVPDFLHSAYKNPLHSMEGALKRLRWACARMISFLGSCPSSHILYRYDLKGLPEHLARFTEGIARRTQKPTGQREIDLRWAPKPVPAKSTSASRQRRLRTTPRKTIASAATEEVIVVEPTPATE